MILKDYFKNNVTFEQSKKDQLNKLYKTGKFKQFSKILLSKEYSAWDGEQMATEDVLEQFKHRIFDYYNGNRDMREFLHTIQQVERATCKSAPLYPVEEEYFNSPDKYRRFARQQASMNNMMEKYNETIKDYQKGCRHSVVFCNDHVASFKGEKELAYALARIHGLEITAQEKDNSSPSREKV